MRREPSVLTLVEKRLNRPLFGGGSGCAGRSFGEHWGCELLLTRASGSISIGGRDEETSESLPLVDGVGDACIELIVVGTADSEDIVGEVWKGLEAMDELVVIAEGDDVGM